MNMAKEILLNFIAKIRRGEMNIQHIEFRRDNYDESKAILLVLSNGKAYRFFITMENKEKMFFLTDVDSILDKILELRIKRIIVDEIQ